MEDLKKCPFCGGDSEIDQIGNEHHAKVCFEVKCTECKVKRKQCMLTRSGVLTIDKLRNLCIKHWNTRV